ncbi:calcium-binding protein [Oleomonas cavernae]|uniref:Calcium-binding protein n=2 Tax=Oleomonas cavernae TaxID=2320859 RepID=A0A418WB10_9PROT|nr:calcium-binding protein [Oleomonas cavernae]
MNAWALSLIFGEAEPGTATKLRIRIDADDYVDLIGTGFTYDIDGTPTGGTVKSMTSVVDGLVQFVLNQFSVPVVDIIATIEAFDANAFLGLFFGGNDRITGDDLDDVLYGFGGSDSMTGGLGNDALFGGDGNDKFYLQDGGIHDTASGGLGNDTYYIDGVDSITEADGEGTDTANIKGDFLLDEGNSIENMNAVGNVDGDITGNQARNNIKGDASDNVLSGAGDRDTIAGGSGIDTINGGDEYDRLFGDGGNDSIFGDDGTDRIEGGTGNDLLYGGGDDNDRDTFIFTVSDVSFGRDTIVDWEDVTDRIQIEGYASFAAAVADGMTISEDAGGNAIIKFTTPISTITLSGIDQSQVTSADFVFIA